MNCTIEACDRPVKARGWCSAHYMRWTRTQHTELRPVASTWFQSGSTRWRIMQLLEVDGGWMTQHMIAADFGLRWPDTNERTIHRAFHRLSNTQWVTTRQVEGSVRTSWNGVSIVNELRAL